MCCWIAAVFQSRSSSILLICRIILYLPFLGFWEYILNLWCIKCWALITYETLILCCFFFWWYLCLFILNCTWIWWKHINVTNLLSLLSFLTQYILLFEQGIFGYNLDQLIPFDLLFKVVPLCHWGKTKKCDV